MKTTDGYEIFEEDFYATPGTMFIERSATLEEKCIHWECPYKGCSYHRYTTSTLPLGDELPIYMPKSKEALKDCMSYLDI